MKPEIGKPAPDFTAPVVGGSYAEGATVSLSDLRGEYVALVFYPKDNTPGCTTQACALRDEWEDVSAKVKVFGVSADSVVSHQKFIDKQSLPYPLISDEEKSVIESYGVWVEKSMYGKQYMGIERSTFVIDPEGNLKAILEKVSPKKHLEQLLESLT